MKELIKILAEHKIKVIKLNFFNPELTLIKGNYTKIKPSKIEILEIKKGIIYFNKLNAYNHTQGIILRNGNVIAKETSKGTKKMLQKMTGIGRAHGAKKGGGNPRKRFYLTIADFDQLTLEDAKDLLAS